MAISQIPPQRPATPVSVRPALRLIPGGLDESARTVFGPREAILQWRAAQQASATAAASRRLHPASGTDTAPAGRARVATSPSPRVAQQAPGRAVLPGAMRRTVVSTLAAVAFLAGCVGAGWGIGTLVAPAPEAAFTYTVQPGDTLWGIAQATSAHNPDDSVAAILALNNLSSSELAVGQQLMLPK